MRGRAAPAGGWAAQTRPSQPDAFLCPPHALLRGLLPPRSAAWAPPTLTSLDRCPPLRREYIRRQNLYRQRVWSCKYSGTGGLTYEEAVASEHKVAAVVDQVCLAASPPMAAPWHRHERLEAGLTCVLRKETEGGWRCRLQRSRLGDCLVWTAPAAGARVTRSMGVGQGRGGWALEIHPCSSVRQLRARAEGSQAQGSTQSSASKAAQLPPWNS